MAKKDFGAINTSKADTGVSTGDVYAEIERGKSAFQQQGTASEQEKKERAATLRTQGRKGCKAGRINMAFSTENHQYIKIMAQITGKTMTEFTNQIIDEYRESHSEVYNQAKALIEQLNSGK